MIITKKQLADEKALIREEAETCEDCDREQRVGCVYYCDYHRSVINYMKKTFKVRGQ